MNTNPHSITLTPTQYRVLKRYTSGDPELQTDRTRSLKTELDRAQRGRSRYHVSFTSENLISARYMLEVHALRNSSAPLNLFDREYAHLMDRASA